MLLLLPMSTVDIKMKTLNIQIAFVVLAICTIFTCSSNANCMTTPCKNGGNCINKNGESRCVCTGLYEGKFCEDMVKRCKSNPCLNGGTCISVGTDYICQCQTPEYRGSRCEFRKPCVGVVCLNGTQCTPTKDGVNYTCTLLPPMKAEGLVGLKEPDPCHKQPCKNGGSCINDRCQCSPEYLGTRCELKNPCLSVVCPKDIKCIPSADGLKYNCTLEASTKNGKTVMTQQGIPGYLMPIVAIAGVLGVVLIYLCFKFGVPKFKYSRIEDSSKEEKSEKQNKGY